MYRGMGEDPSDFLNRILTGAIGTGVTNTIDPPVNPNFARKWVQLTQHVDTSQMSDAQVVALYNNKPLGSAIGTGVTDTVTGFLDWDILGIPLKYWLLIGGAVFILKR
jgi:hypothetical protein